MISTNYDANSALENFSASVKLHLMIYCYCYSFVV